VGCRARPGARPHRPGAAARARPVAVAVGADDQRPRDPDRAAPSGDRPDEGGAAPRRRGGGGDVGQRLGGLRSVSEAARGDGCRPGALGIRLAGGADRVARPGGIRAALAYDRTMFEVINLGNNRTVTMLEMVRGIEEALGVSAAIEWLPEQPGDVPQTWAGIDKARSLLGYDPRTTYAEGVTRFIDWLRESKRVESTAEAG